jgi:hypothetical protein
MISPAQALIARRTAGEQLQSSQAVHVEQMLVTVSRVLMVADGHLKVGQRDAGLEVVQA